MFFAPIIVLLISLAVLRCRLVQVPLRRPDRPRPLPAGRPDVGRGRLQLRVPATHLALLLHRVHLRLHGHLPVRPRRRPRRLGQPHRPRGGRRRVLGGARRRRLPPEEDEGARREERRGAAKAEERVRRRFRAELRSTLLCQKPRIAGMALTRQRSG